MSVIEASTVPAHGREELVFVEHIARPLTGGILGRDGIWVSRYIEAPSLRERQSPLTFTNCFKTYFTSTRSRACSITSSMSLYAAGISSISSFD
jgi:hypothetical protein